MDEGAAFRFSPRPNRAAEIEWRPWGEPAFDEARRLGRPVLLALSAVWCHWCHVMDETSYSDPAVIAAINAGYVPVRVDNDRRPDVNRRYNMGGWPSTVFLTPGGDIITGATYVPPDQLRGALESVREFFDANAASLQHVEPPELEEPGDEPHEADDAALGLIPDRLAAAAVAAFDPVYGGIGTEPKFPQADVFAFLLSFAALRPESSDAPRAQEVLVKTLEAMARGGLRDHGGRGFFRYATQRDWSEPHYEKMLEDEAKLALLYVEALGLAKAGKAGLGEPELYREAAEDVLALLQDTMWLGEPPAFAGSQDADETYYELDAEARGELPAPALDRTVYVDWNALAVRALLRGAATLERPELAGRALETLGFIWREGRRDGYLVHFIADGAAAQGSPLFADQAAVAAALLDAYEATGDRVWLERAAELVERATPFVSKDGRYDDRLPSSGDSPGLLSRPVPALDENATFVDTLLRLTSHSGDERFRDGALDVLAAWLPYYERYDVGAAPYGAALLRAGERREHVVVIGRRGDDAARRLQAAALAAPRPLLTVQLLDPDDPADARHMAAAGYDRAGHAAAYVCQGRVCRDPVADTEALTEVLAAS